MWDVGRKQVILIWLYWKHLGVLSYKVDETKIEYIVNEIDS